MNAKNFLFRTAGLVAGALLLTGRLAAAEADAFPVFENNYIRISGSGSAAQRKALPRPHW